MINFFVLLIFVVISILGCEHTPGLNPGADAAYNRGKADGQSMRQWEIKENAYQQGVAAGYSGGTPNIDFFIGVRSGGKYGAFRYNSTPYGLGGWRGRPIYWPR